MITEATMKRKFAFTLYFTKDNVIGSMAIMAPPWSSVSEEQLFTQHEIQEMQKLYEDLPKPQWSNDLIKRQVQLHDFQEKIKGIIKARRS